MPLHSVLFVCTANICRSPLAEGLLKARIADDPDEWRIESAGVWASPGQPAAFFTRQVLQDRGVILPDQRSRRVSRMLLSEFNLILVMERAHKDTLWAAFPDLAGRILTLCELTGAPGDIDDPVGQPIEAYELTARKIETLLDTGFERLRTLA